MAWLYYSPDYFGGGIFGWGYALFPVLLLPLALERSIQRLVVLASLSFAVGVLYGMSATYAIAVFGSFAAAVWIVIEVANVRGLVVRRGECRRCRPRARAGARPVRRGRHRRRAEQVRIVLRLDANRANTHPSRRSHGAGGVGSALAPCARDRRRCIAKTSIMLVKLSAIYVVLMMLDP